MESDVDAANNCVNNSLCLRENDIPGALLGDRDQRLLKISELKSWLIYRSASTKGRKPSLF